MIPENIAIAPSPSPRNEDKLEIVSISDDEEIAALLKLNNSNEMSKLSSTKQNDTTPYSIMDAAVKTSDTSFVLQPVREEQPQQPRPNKLSRSRAPLNQSKSKESKSLLMSLDASPSTMNNNFNSNHTDNNSELMNQRAIENGACAASTMLSSIPSFSQSSSSNGGSAHCSNSNNKNDGNLLPLSRLDSMSRSTHDANSKRSASAMPMQSAVTSFASNVNSIEPELVLSPAKLGQ